MDTIKRSLLACLTGAALMVPFSCGPVSPVIITDYPVRYDLSGNALYGSIRSAEVNIYDFSEGEKGEFIAKLMTNDAGLYEGTADIPSSVSVLLYEVTDGYYFEEADGQQVYIGSSTPLTAIISLQSSESQALPVYLSPWSHIAAGLAIRKIELGTAPYDAAIEANAEISKVLGVDILNTQPVDVAEHGVSSYNDSVRYGYWIGAISQLALEISAERASQHGYSSATITQMMYADIQRDGVLDGYDNRVLIPQDQLRLDANTYNTRLATAMMRLTKSESVSAKVEPKLLADSATLYQAKLADAGIVSSDNIQRVSEDAGPVITFPDDQPQILTGVATIRAIITSALGLDHVDVIIDGTSIAMEQGKEDHYHASIPTTSISDGDYTLVVAATDLKGTESRLTLPVRIANEGTAIGFFKPEPSEIDEERQTVTRFSWIREVTSFSAEFSDPIAIEDVWLEVGRGTGQHINTLKVGDNRYTTNIDTEWFGNGRVDLLWKAKNEAGIVTAADAVTYFIDNTEPTITRHFPIYNNLFKQWIKGDFVVDFTAADTNLEKSIVYVDGEELITLVPDFQSAPVLDTTTLDDGERTLVIEAVDYAGNRKSMSTKLFVDNTAPVFVLENNEFASGVELKTRTTVRYLIHDRTDVSDITARVSDTVLTSTSFRDGSDQLYLQIVLDPAFFLALKSENDNFLIMLSGKDEAGNVAEATLPITLNVGKDGYFQSPESGAILASEQLFEVILSNTLDVRSVNLEIGDYSPRLTDEGNGLYSGSIETSVVDDGPLQVVAVITTSFTTNSFSLPIHIDNTPPVIAFAGGGRLYKDANGQDAGECKDASYAITEVNPQTVSVTWKQQPASSDATGSYEIAAGEQGTFTYTITDKAGNEIEGTHDIECEDLRTAVVFNQPQDGQHIRGSATFKITAAAATRVEISFDGGINYTVMRSANGVFESLIDTTRLDEDTYTVMAKATIGGEPTFAEQTVVIDNTPPVIALSGGGQIIYQPDGVTPTVQSSGCVNPTYTITEANLQSISVQWKEQPASSAVSGSFELAEGEQGTIVYIVSDQAGNQISGSQSFSCEVIYQSQPTELSFTAVPEKWVPSLPIRRTIPPEVIHAQVTVQGIHKGEQGSYTGDDLTFSGNANFSVYSGLTAKKSDSTNSWNVALVPPDDIQGVVKLELNVTNSFGYTTPTIETNVLVDTALPVISGFTVSPTDLSRDSIFEIQNSPFRRALWNDTFEIEFYVTDTGTRTSYVYLEQTKGTAHASNIKLAEKKHDGSYVRFVIDPDDYEIATGSYYLYVYSTDSVGRDSARDYLYETVTFIFDNTPPAVTFTEFDGGTVTDEMAQAEGEWLFDADGKLFKFETTREYATDYHRLKPLIDGAVLAVPGSVTCESPENDPLKVVCEFLLKAWSDVEQLVDTSLSFSWTDIAGNSYTWATEKARFDHEPPQINTHTHTTYNQAKESCNSRNTYTHTVSDNSELDADRSEYPFRLSSDKKGATFGSSLHLYAGSAGKYFYDIYGNKSESTKVHSTTSSSSGNC